MLCASSFYAGNGGTAHSGKVCEIGLRQTEPSPAFSDPFRYVFVDSMDLLL